MTHDLFLTIVHMRMGERKLDGFLYKQLARKLRISRPLCSQYLRGDLAMPPEIKAKIIEILNLEHVLRRVVGEIFQITFGVVSVQNLRNERKPTRPLFAAVQFS